MQVGRIVAARRAHGAGAVHLVVLRDGAWGLEGRLWEGDALCGLRALAWVPCAAGPERCCPRCAAREKRARRSLGARACPR